MATCVRCGYGFQRQGACRECGGEEFVSPNDERGQASRRRRLRVIQKAYQVMNRESGGFKAGEGAMCRDCGKAADCWDHRDYWTPTLAEPVCFSCNSRRGPGYTLPPDERGGFVIDVKVPGIEQCWNCKHSGSVRGSDDWYCKRGLGDLEIPSDERIVSETHRCDDYEYHGQNELSVRGCSSTLTRDAVGVE